MSASATRQEIKSSLLPCAKCGDTSPIGSLVVEGPRRDMRITGTQYTCMGDDCNGAGLPGNGDEAARKNWNSEQERIKAEADAAFEQMNARLP